MIDYWQLNTHAHINVIGNKHFFLWIKIKDFYYNHQSVYARTFETFTLKEAVQIASISYLQ